MKRQFLVFGLAFTIAMGMASCKQKSEAPAAAEQAETEQVETKQPSAEEIVAKAKAEGANWSVDEWKASTKDMTKSWARWKASRQSLNPSKS